jgi:hypothetical protein
MATVRFVSFIVMSGWEIKMRCTGRGRGRGEELHQRRQSLRKLPGLAIVRVVDASCCVLLQSILAVFAGFQCDQYDYYCERMFCFFS